MTVGELRQLLAFYEDHVPVVLSVQDVEEESFTVEFTDGAVILED